MRAIKFRIYCDLYDDPSKHMFYDGIWFDNDGWYIENGWYYIDDLIDDLMDDEEPCKCEIMQYIWIKDKNGKEIYEGDLVECIANGKYGSESWVYPIEYFVDGQAFLPNFACNLWWWWWASIEVIGNIYENHEIVTWQRITN